GLTPAAGASGPGTWTCAPGGYWRPPLVPRPRPHPIAACLPPSPCGEGGEGVFLTGPGSGERLPQLVQVAVLVLEHVGDGGPDGTSRPLRPADGPVEVLLGHGEERPPQGLARLEQLAADTAEVPVDWS